MPDFAHRTLTPELMDAADVEFADYRACLRDLATVNVLTLAYRPTLAWLDRLARTGRLAPGRPVVILDVGSGYGDMLRQIDRWAARRDLSVDMIGLDHDPRAARAAAEATTPDRPIRWVTADCFAWPPDGRVDLIVSSLFGHHLDDTELVRFLGWMEATAAVGWFVNDLHRHPVSYYGFMALSRLARWHRFVRHDGLVSIGRAFVKSDWRRALAEAGLPAGDVEMSWWMPFRLCLSRVRTA